MVNDVCIFGYLFFKPIMFKVFLLLASFKLSWPVVDYTFRQKVRQAPVSPYATEFYWPTWMFIKLDLNDILHNIRL